MRKRKKQKETPLTPASFHPQSEMDSVLVSSLAFFIPYSTCESETAMSHALKVCRISIATAIQKNQMHSVELNVCSIDSIHISSIY